ncbi:hypothetical protein VNO77_08373 [Canavalia gladiata]|uniref:Uncharacterized protein n=1 Tax=Canavalia gladiata TaxID=3824 RepID=A0AAN9M8H5_CANGL
MHIRFLSLRRLRRSGPRARAGLDSYLLGAVCSLRGDLSHVGVFCNDIAYGSSICSSMRGLLCLVHAHREHNMLVGAGCYGREWRVWRDSKGDPWERPRDLLHGHFLLPFDLPGSVNSIRLRSPCSLGIVAVLLVWLSRGRRCLPDHSESAPRSLSSRMLRH